METPLSPCESLLRVRVIGTLCARVFVSVDLCLSETKTYVCIQRKCHYKLALTCPLTVLTSLTLSSSEENAERIMLDPTSRENLKFKDLLKVVWDQVLHTNMVSLQHNQSSKKSEENST